MLAEDCDLSFTNLTLVNERKEIVDFRDHSGVDRFDNEYLLKYHLMRHLTGTPTFMYKAEKLREIGGFNDAKVSQEFYLMLKSIEAGLKIRYMNESDVIAYRHSDGGISHGQTKINGEKYLYEFKQQYFDRFTAKERRFITFRYYAVMAVAYIRNKNYFKALGSAIRMFFTSPLHLLKEGLRFISNKSKAKKNAD